MRYLSIVLIIFCSISYSQVGIGTTMPNPSSILDIQSDKAGLLIPRLTELQKNNIDSPSVGLLIYQTNQNKGFWYFNGTMWKPLGLNYDFENGLTEIDNKVTLGGILVNETDIDLDNNDMSFSLSDSGEFIISEKHEAVNRERLKISERGDVYFGTDENNEAMVVNAETNVVDFGFKQSDYDYVGNGGAVADHSGSMIFMRDYVASFDNGDPLGAGTTIGTGSIEYITDGSYCTYFSNSVLPIHDVSYGPVFDINYMNLGAPTHRWKEVYTQDGVFQTSDFNLKTNIKKSNYGLDAIMKLKPVMYNWKSDVKNEKMTKKMLRSELKIGLIAQEVLEVIPEVVKTHSWKKTSVNGSTKEKDMISIYTKNEKMGMNYTELIPVLIKAVQEQQEEIKVLKKALKIN